MVREDRDARSEGTEVDERRSVNEESSGKAERTDVMLSNEDAGRVWRRRITQRTAGWVIRVICRIGAPAAIDSAAVNAVAAMVVCRESG